MKQDLNVTNYSTSGGKAANFSKFFETDGGKICVIVGLIVFILVGFTILILTGHAPSETARTVCVGAVSSLFTILYPYLNPKGTK